MNRRTTSHQAAGEPSPDKVPAQTRPRGAAKPAAAKPAGKTTKRRGQPVPVDVAGEQDHWTEGHRTSIAVHKGLTCEPGLEFASLVVREIPGGVCLDGVVTMDDSGTDIASLVKKAAGVEKVLNRLVVQECEAASSHAAGPATMRGE